MQTHQSGLDSTLTFKEASGNTGARLSIPLLPIPLYQFSSLTFVGIARGELVVVVGGESRSKQMIAHMRICRTPLSAQMCSRSSTQGCNLHESKAPFNIFIITSQVCACTPPSTPPPPPHASTDTHARTHASNKSLIIISHRSSQGQKTSVPLCVQGIKVEPSVFFDEHTYTHTLRMCVCVSVCVRDKHAATPPN